jgi:hypothetical protein
LEFNYASEKFLTLSRNVIGGGGKALHPGEDNLISLGVSARRWTAVYAVNGTIQTSDENLKENITLLNYGVNDILKLRPVSFRWKNSNSEQRKIGLLAQEVEQIIPEVVIPPETENDYYGLNYADLVSVLIKGIQEQQFQIEELKSYNKELEVRLSAIEAKLLSSTQTSSTLKTKSTNP